jgi:hypothetical protein
MTILSFGQGTAGLRLVRHNGNPLFQVGTALRSFDAQWKNVQPMRRNSIQMEP